MKTFLEVEGKMGPIPQPAGSQYRPPQLDTNPNVRKDNAAEKRRGQHPQKGLGLAQLPSLVRQLSAQPPATVSKVKSTNSNRCFRE